MNSRYFGVLRPPGRSALGALVVSLALAGCGSDTDPAAPADAKLEITLSSVPTLDPQREGWYEAWVIDRSGVARSAGRFVAGGPVEMANPVSGVVAFQITVEPPNDTDPGPSPQILLRGDLEGRTARLSVEGALTAANLPLQEKPGQYTVFTPSDNHKLGYPSNEYAGIWLLNSTVASQGIDQWVRLTPLKEGWLYEGWAVRDYGQPEAIWLSYGKFRSSNIDGAVDTRDDTGWGPFSGVDDYVTAGLENYPGDDWVDNPLGFPVPGNLELPIDLREKDAAGQYRWTHLISIEPAWNQGEPLTTERPFFLQLYHDRFIDNGIGRGRPITFHPGRVPSGEVRIR